MAERVALSARGASAAANSAFLALSRHWLIWLHVLLGIWVLLPWLAPVLMRLGWTVPASAIYLGYAPQCHQLPQRSYFLFGPPADAPAARYSGSLPHE